VVEVRNGQRRVVAAREIGRASVPVCVVQQMIDAGLSVTALSHQTPPKPPPGPKNPLRRSSERVLARRADTS